MLKSGYFRHLMTRTHPRCHCENILVSDLVREWRCGALNVEQSSLVVCSGRVLSRDVGSVFCGKRRQAILFGRTVSRQQHSLNQTSNTPAQAPHHHHDTRPTQLNSRRILTSVNPPFSDTIPLLLPTIWIRQTATVLASSSSSLLLLISPIQLLDESPTLFAATTDNDRYDPTTPTPK